MVCSKAPNIPQLTRNKAAAHGAVSYYFDHRVTSRVAKHTFGVPCHVPYQPGNKEHEKRKFCKYRSDAGTWYIPGAFDIILPRVSAISTGIYVLDRSIPLEHFGV